MITFPHLSLIHGCNIHETAKVMPFVNLYDSDIGADCFIGPFVEIGGSVIGARTKISSHTYIPPLCTIGSDCFIAHGVQFTNDRYNTHFGEPWVPEKTVIGNRVRIGSGCVILPITIGDDCIVGAGSVVTRDMPSGEIWCGIPARLHVKTGHAQT